MIQKTEHDIDQILSRQPLFRGLSANELAQLSLGAREFRVLKNEMIFSKGDPPAGIHVVVMGQIKLFIPTANGWEKVVHLQGAGTCFGEALVFLDRPYPVSAQATQDSIVVLLDKHVLLEAIETSSEFCKKLLASLSLRLHELMGDMEACTLRSSAERVICFLSQHAPREANRFDIALGTSKQTIASQLNLAPETLSRVLGHLSGAGLIEVKGRTITVLDLQRMRQFAG